MQMVRPILSVLLILTLVATGQSVAAAKGANPATGLMTLCIGQGVVVVFIDDEGQPTSAPHLCPDCAMAALSGPIPPDAVPHAIETRDRSADILPEIALVQRAFARPGFPRGPPRPV